MSHSAIIQFECLIMMAIISDEHGRYVSLKCDDSRDLLLFHVVKIWGEKECLVWCCKMRWGLNINSHNATVPIIILSGRADKTIHYFHSSHFVILKFAEGFVCDLFLVYNNFIMWCVWIKQCKRTQIDPWWIRQNVWHLVHFSHNLLFLLGFLPPAICIMLKILKKPTKRLATQTISVICVCLHWVCVCVLC